MTTTTGYLINPHDKTVSIVTLPLIDDNVPVKSMYPLLDCDLVDCAHIRGTHSERTSFDLWVDDEGLMKEEQAFFYVTHEAGAAYGHRMFAGKALVLSSDREGNTKGATVDLRTLSKRIVWAHPDEGKREAGEMLDRSGQVLTFDSMDDLVAYMRKAGAI